MGSSVRISEVVVTSFAGFMPYTRGQRCRRHIYQLRGMRCRRSSDKNTGIYRVRMEKRSFMFCLTKFFSVCVDRERKLRPCRPDYSFRRGGQTAGKLARTTFMTSTMPGFLSTSLVDRRGCVHPLVQGLLDVSLSPSFA